MGDLIDSYHNANNTEGYRVYKDGWCEYWGLYDNLPCNSITEVTLLKHFKLVNNSNWHVNTYKDYGGVQVTCSQVGYGYASTLSGAFSASNKIKLCHQHTEGKVSMSIKWGAKGYLTDEEMSKYNL